MVGVILIIGLMIGAVNVRMHLEVLNMIGCRRILLMKEKQLLMGTKLTIGLNMANLIIIIIVQLMDKICQLSIGKIGEVKAN